MKPPDSKCYFSTESYSLLFSSLKRYFHYILDQQLNSYSESDSNVSPQVLLIHHEERDNPQFLNFITNTHNIKVVIVGYDAHSQVNLLDFSNLSTILKRCLANLDIQTENIFTKEEINEKLKNFFHSHGEDSLFEYLNWTIYYLREGPIQFINNEISYQDYCDKFLKIGVKNWNEFKNRYLKYKYFMKLGNYIPHFSYLEEIINESDYYVILLQEMRKEEMEQKKDIFFLENIDKIRKIDEILIEIFKEFH